MPFGQTIYLDTDTYVVDNIDELFDLLERFDIAAAHAPGYTGDDRGPSEAFYELNTGVIPYRGTGAVGEFLAKWAELYARWFRSPPSRLAPPASTSPLHRMAGHGRLWHRGRLCGSAAALRARTGDLREGARPRASGYGDESQ